MTHSASRDGAARWIAAQQDNRTAWFMDGFLIDGPPGTSPVLSLLSMQAGKQATDVWFGLG